MVIYPEGASISIGMRLVKLCMEVLLDYILRKIGADNFVNAVEYYLNHKFDTAVAFSPMDLSVEAEAFGSPIHYSDDEVPTVTAALIHDAEEAETLQVPDVGAGRTGECVSGIREVSGLIVDRPVMAGIIGPYSLAGRLLDMTEIMILCFEEPELVETVLTAGGRESG